VYSQTESETEIDLGYRPRVTLYGNGEPYEEKLDLADTYGAIVCSYTGNHKLLGGDTLEGSERPRGPKKSPKADGRSYGGLVFRRVGTGEERARCGEVFFTGACSDRECKASKPTPIPHTCDRYDCPTCYHHAIRRMAKRSADRLNSFPKELKEETGLSAGNLKHYVFTFSPEKWRRDRCIGDAGKALYRLLDKALRYAAKDGFFAFEAMVHLQREQHKDGSYCDREECNIPASEHIWTWGPHVHAVGYGHLMNTKELHGNPEFRSINIVQVKEAPGKKRDAFATLFYQGTHASVFYRQDTGKQASKLVRHMGHIAPRLYRQKVVGHTYEVKSCTCGQPMKVYPVQLDMMPDRTIDYGPLYDRRPVYEYRFNQRRLTDWIRERDHLGRVWLSRRAKALRERASE
jgi:hypothetical protein